MDRIFYGFKFDHWCETVVFYKCDDEYGVDAVIEWDQSTLGM